MEIENSIETPHNLFLEIYVIFVSFQWHHYSISVTHLHKIVSYDTRSFTVTFNISIVC